MNPTRLRNHLETLFQTVVIEKPLFVIIGLTIIISFLGYSAVDLKIDASAESLLLENDQDLHYTRKVTDRYSVHDFLVISYTPEDGDVLSGNSITNLENLRDDLTRLKPVESVTTILDVPLLESPIISYAQLSEQIPTLQSPAVDRDLARKELAESPFYRNLLVSPDLKTTAVIINLKTDQAYRALLSERNLLLAKHAEGNMTDDETDRLRTVRKDIRQRLDQMNVIQHENIRAIRSIMDKYRSSSELFLGGVSMIADDLINYIKKDLQVFGFGVFALLLVVLGLIFRRLIWIILPMTCCFISVVAMMGLLVLFDFEVTVISSNFISLQLIITLAISIHLIVRYNEFLADNPKSSQRELVQRTIRTKFMPCLYAALTTIAGFSSLLLCDIVPVVNFGWMMSAGILLSLMLTFLLFPAGMMVVRKEPVAVPPKRLRFSATRSIAEFTAVRGKFIMIVSIALLCFGVMGILRLEVENSFIDYFKDNSEIYQGLQRIDRKLGGTTPLDVIIEFEDYEEAAENSFDDDPDEYEDSEEDPAKYWFTDDIISVSENVHDYLESLPETGKVLSLGSLLKTARRLNKGKSLDSLEMSVLYSKMSEELKQIVLYPYASTEYNEIRFAVRIKDSLKTLKRDRLLKKIQTDLAKQPGMENVRVRLAGTMVLYNNMLNSLFRSQILTLGIVVLALLFMFYILFRSIRIALIALLPNLLSSCVVLGIMGWLGIPLDMMTITIAAISIGIAVDDTIHYIHRFREEIKKDGDYHKALLRCHSSIGKAMYYTSITIIIGFSILMLSNFYPTIYFGLFTGLAMLIALIAALTLLPRLLIVFKPFDRPAAVA
ncbi:MAG: RND family transporter [Desulfobacteraceae bacterium]|nr:MAG: RND family transporter [Desulfobacteraceae bacterium]